MKINQIDWRPLTRTIEDVWFFSKFSVKLRSAMFSTGFNARVIAHLKHSSSQFFRSIIAFAARNFGSGIIEEPPSSAYFTVWRSRLKTERNVQLLHCLWIFAKDSKIVYFIFVNNSLEFILSEFTFVSEWNAASLAIISPPFRSNFFSIHEKINFTLNCRLLFGMFVIDCLALTRNKSESHPFFSCIRYCIANFFNAYFDSFNWNEVPLLLYSL